MTTEGYGRMVSCDALLPRKASGLFIRVPVPKTDTGGIDEYSKARGLNLSKELGKLTPYVSYKGCLARGHR